VLTTDTPLDHFVTDESYVLPSGHEFVPSDRYEYHEENGESFVCRLPSQRHNTNNDRDIELAVMRTVDMNELGLAILHELKEPCIKDNRGIKDNHTLSFCSRNNVTFNSKVVGVYEAGVSNVARWNQDMQGIELVYPGLEPCAADMDKGGLTVTRLVLRCSRRLDSDKLFWAVNDKLSSGCELYIEAGVLAVCRLEGRLLKKRNKVILCHRV